MGNLGIVGHAGEKFTPETEARAREVIRNYIRYCRPSAVVSGHCPMGGVDIYAEQEAWKLEVPLILHVPRKNSWEGDGKPSVEVTQDPRMRVIYHSGFKARNLAIAQDSAMGLCVVVKDYIKGFNGMVFKDCYHCRGKNPHHIKSGGCWTVWRTPVRRWEII